PSGDGQPEAGAAHLARTPFVNPVEAVEDSLAVLLRNARALVAHRYRRVAAVASDIDVDPRLPRSVFDRVVHDVRDRVPQYQSISRPSNSGRRVAGQPLLSPLGQNPEGPAAIPPQPAAN